MCRASPCPGRALSPSALRCQTRGSSKWEKWRRRRAGGVCGWSSPERGGWREGPGRGGFATIPQEIRGGFYVGQSCAPIDVFVQIREQVMGKSRGQFWKQEASQKVPRGEGTREACTPKFKQLTAPKCHHLALTESEISNDLGDGLRTKWKKQKQNQKNSPPWEDSLCLPSSGPREDHRWPLAAGGDVLCVL